MHRTSGHFITFCGILALTSTSCFQIKHSARTVQLDTISVSAHNNPMDIYRAAAPTTWDITHIDAEVFFNLESKTMNGMATYDIRTTRDIYSHEMQLPLDAKSIEVLTVKSLPSHNSLPFKILDDQVWIDFKPLASERFNPFTFNLQDTFRTEVLPYNDTFRIQMRYVAKPYEKAAGGSAAIREDRGLYFINTNNEFPGKPLQIWTQGETEANSHWLPLIDKPNERFTIRLAMTVPDSLTTLSNGKITERKKNGTLRTDVWESTDPLAAYLVSMVVGKYAVVTDRKALGKVVDYYVEPEYSASAKGIFNHTPEMIEFFSQATGTPFPWDKYSQVTVRDFVAGAMENTSASTFGDFVQKDIYQLRDDHNDEIVAHELFHQWFGDLVTAESWSNITLNESFATYGEYLWKAYKYGRDAGDEENVNAINAYLNSTKYSDAPLARYHYRSKEVVFDRISYQKGGAILRHLNDIIGDDAMRRAMKIYLNENAHQPAEIAQWRMAVEKAYGTDMNWFFKQWYDQPGYPQLQLDYVDDTIAQQLYVVIKQADSAGVYRLPLTAALVYGKHLTPLTWQVNKKKDTLSIPYKEGQRPVFIADYKSTLVGTLQENKPIDDWMSQLLYSERGMNRLKALKQIMHIQNRSNNKVDSLQRQALAHALDDAYSTVRSQAIALLHKEGTSSSNQQFWIPALKSAAQNDIDNNVRSAAIRLIGTWKLKDYRDDYAQWLNDSSYKVKAAALYALHQLDSGKGYHQAKMFLSANVQGALKKEAWDIIGTYAKDEDIQLFYDYLPTYRFKEDLHVYQALLHYMRRTKSIQRFHTGLEILQQMTAATSFSRTRQTAVHYIESAFITEKTDDIPLYAEKKKELNEVVKMMNNKEQNPSIKNIYSKILAN